MNKPAPFTFEPFSVKQKKLLTWWMDRSPHRDKDVVICDGSVRSGKTLATSLSFVMWAMETFNGENLGMAGKSIGALRRNVVLPLKMVLRGRGYRVKDRRSTENFLEVTRHGRVNYFYLFGGKDERSQDFIQGITLAGMYFDEVALMPESFVNQATARCSVDGAKLWFTCNPEGPFHWFKLNWIDQPDKKNALYLKFVMDDNLSLTERVRERYRRMYSGVFYRRYVLGEWVMAEGVVYDMFDQDVHMVDDEQLPDRFDNYIVGIDHGVGNPTAFILIGIRGDRFYVIKEYYHEGAAGGSYKSDLQYSSDFKVFLRQIKPSDIYYDPSALHLYIQFRNDGIENLKQANNDVLNGISTVSTFFSEKKLFVHKSCTNLLHEIYNYAWDPKAQARGEDKPIKQTDHALDALRYAIYTYYMRSVLRGRRNERRQRERPAGRR